MSPDRGGIEDGEAPDGAGPMSRKQWLGLLLAVVLILATLVLIVVVANA